MKNSAILLLLLLCRSLNDVDSRLFFRLFHRSSDGASQESEDSGTRGFLRRLKKNRNKNKKGKTKTGETTPTTTPPTFSPTRHPTNRPTPSTPASNFNIQLVNMGKVSSYDGQFAFAKARWEAIIVNDLSDVSRNDKDWFNGRFDQPFTGDVDDVVIGYSIEPIDGPGEILGYSGPLYYRPQSNTTISGIMKFDQEDFDIKSPQDVAIIVLHEMGHVLGLVGSMGLCTAGCGTNSNKEFEYKCNKAKDAYKNLNFKTKTKQLLLENDGGPGTRCSHWDEDSFQDDESSELMTGFFEAWKAQSISRVTLAALEDINPNGYVVNYDEADPFPFVSSKNNNNIVVSASQNTNLSNDDDHHSRKTSVLKSDTLPSYALQKVLIPSI